MRYTREQACLAWLAQGMLGSRRLKKLLDEYGSAEAAYDAFQRDNGASLQNRISDYSLSLLRASASREKLHDMLVTMRKWNMGLEIGRARLNSSHTLASRMPSSA